MTENQTPAAKSVTTRRCNCGCGEATSSSKTQYKPGHDARHVGIVARDAAESAINGTDRQFAYEDLGSAALITKADAMAKRLVQRFQEAAAKAQIKADRKPAKDRKSKAAKADAKAADTLAAKVAAEEAAHAAALAVEVELRRADSEAMFAAEEAAELDEDRQLTDREAPEAERTVKVGRWEYPAIVTGYAEDGTETLERNTKRDGSGEWVPYTAK